MAFEDAPVPQRSSDSAAIQFWSLIHETIQEDTNTGPSRLRWPSLNIPLYGADVAAPAIGWVHSVGVTFNCRIVGYQLFALIPGQMSIDIQRSDIVSHPSATFDPTPYQFPSMVGDPSLAPSINGAFSDSFTDEVNMTLWAFRDLAVGDMLHIYIIATDGLPRMVTLLLYLQDLDART